jgi:Rieske Fe-S protein
MSNDPSNELTRAIDTLRDRRTVLRGAAVAGLAGAGLPLLAACGGDDSASTAPTQESQESRPSASGSPSSAGGGAVLGPTSEIPVGGGVIYPDAKVVVTQPVKGEFKGFSAVCTHAGCIVAKVTDGTIDCSCHGSKFKVADGSVAQGPAASPLAPVAVTVKGTEILAPPS